MLINDAVREYLRAGGKISSGYSFKVGYSPMFGRNELLGMISVGRVCLHWGCADHADLIRSKRKKGVYLHDVLERKSNKLLGVDSNVSSLVEMKKLGIQEVYAFEELPSDISFDVVFVPDVIEHVLNVGDFLGQVKSVSSKEYVFSTPNAYRLKNRFLFRREFINTDHKYWFSAYTLSKVLTESGYSVADIWYTDVFKWSSPISSILKWIIPLFRDGIVIKAVAVEEGVK